MDIGTISTRYAKALMIYASERGAEDTVYREIETLSRSFSKFPQLRESLNNPVLKAKNKQDLIVAAAVGDAEPSKEFARFVELVIKQHREFFLQFMCLTYITFYYHMKHIAVGTLITAVPVDDDTKRRIKETAAATVHAGMKLQTWVDPSIEGGFIFDINDYRLDASIATQLKRVKQQFIDKNKRIV
ncbi:MAG: F0F1 ATP synthase subunit delta [Mediterranea sp.]|jgi:F-type H+-transporting ATPase subunit delta|nr:F0F1 ATP synthase subunit delta [Mediterranea sp.]